MAPKSIPLPALIIQLELHWCCCEDIMPHFLNNSRPFAWCIAYHFSHTGDWLFQATNDTDFNPGSKTSYQEMTCITLSCLSNSSLKAILEPGMIYDWIRLSIKMAIFLMFWAIIANLCIDRIEYNPLWNYIEIVYRRMMCRLILSTSFDGTIGISMMMRGAARSLADVSMAISNMAITLTIPILSAFFNSKIT